MSSSTSTCGVATAQPDTTTTPSTSAPLTSLSDIIDVLGFGRYQRMRGLILGMVYMSDAMEIILLTFINRSAVQAFDAKEIYTSLLPMSIFIGMLFGAAVLGGLADHFGRKKATLISLFVTALAGVASAGATSMTMLIVLRCIVGMGIGGIHCCLTLFLELTPTENRTKYMILVFSFWSVGIVFECGLAALLRNVSWRWLVGASAVPSFILVPLIWFFVPESPRFLLVHGRVSEAESIIKDIAECNGRALPRYDLRGSGYDGAKGMSAAFSALKYGGPMRPMILVLWLASFVAATTYYGFILIASRVVSNAELSEYVSELLLGLSELPGYALLHFVSNAFGRKMGLAGLQVTCGLSILIVQGLMNSSFGTLFPFLLMTRTLSHSVFTCTWMLSLEAIPTVMRSAVLGSGSAWARVAAASAPFFAFPLYGITQWGTVAFFTAINILAGIATLLVSFETRGRQLEDTLLPEVQGTANSMSDVSMKEVDTCVEAQGTNRP